MIIDSPQKVQDLYEDDEFEELLGQASAAAANEWESEFVDGLNEKFETYGRRMFLSARQQEILERIAGDS